MKKCLALALALILALILALAAVPTLAEYPAFEGIVCIDSAAIYADEALTHPLGTLPRRTIVTYDSGEIGQPVLAVQAGGLTGFMPQTSIGLLTTEEWQGYDFAVVLCETLSRRALPKRSGAKLGTLRTGDAFTILAEQGGFYLACRRSEDGTYDETGWVDAAYTVKNPATITTNGTVHALAYADPAAPRVAEISAGTELFCIAQTGAYYVVSLRGASAFIPCNAKITVYGAY